MVEKIDLLCGGFPCPPVSQAAGNRREFEKDERWLWPEFFKAICIFEPKWVVVENVPGLLSARDGKLFAGILRDLAQVGYDAEWYSLPASLFGAPHKRERLFIIANSHGIRLDAYKVLTAISDQINFEWEYNVTHISFEEIGRSYIGISEDLLQSDGLSFTDVEIQQWVQAFGNSVVPQVSEAIGKIIIQAEQKNPSAVAKGET